MGTPHVARFHVSSVRAARREVVPYIGDHRGCLHDGTITPDAAYIAAASPDVILGLLDRIAELEKALEFAVAGLNDPEVLGEVAKQRAKKALGWPARSSSKVEST